MRPPLRIAGVALVCFAHAASASTPACRQRVLEELGWRLVATDAGAPRIEPGTPCDRTDLAEAHAAGDLVVRVPRRLDDAARADLHASLLQHPATHCAYGFALGDATRRAADKLAANDGYRFSSLQLGWIGFGLGGSERQGWAPLASLGRAFKPHASNAAAIETFYTGKVRSECGVGRQVAQYATLRELFGREGFDTSFAADEIVIGTFVRVEDSGSVLLGAAAGERTRDPLAVAASRDGRQAFMGLPGHLKHVFDARTLDDINNQAQNFVVYDVDAEAAEALRRHGGFDHYNKRARALWELARQLPDHEGGRYFEKVLVDHDPTWRAQLTPAQRDIVARMDAELADPFFRGFRLYVHDHGIRSVGFHLARMLDRNPRTPFRLELAPHNVHTTLYDRWIAHRLAQCGE